MVMAGQHCECANATEMDMENSENGDFYVVYFATMKIIPFLGMIKKKRRRNRGFGIRLLRVLSLVPPLVSCV